MLIAGFNLASADYRRIRRQRLQALGAAAVLALALLAQGAFWAVVHRDTAATGRRLAAMEQEVRRHEDQVRALRANIPADALKGYEARLAAYNKILEAGAFSWTGLLLELERAVPPGVELRAIQPDPTTGRVALTGQCRDFEDISRLVQSLSQRPAFREVDLLQQAERRPGPGEPGGLSFNLSMLYEGRPQ
jgi:Tfp pilus assembly protein PilN